MTRGQSDEAAHRAARSAMEELVGELCSPRCAGRAPGTAEGEAARAVVLDALRSAGLDPVEQPVPGCGGANVLAALPGDVDRWVLVEAHYDHLGRHGEHVYWGADDNAAAVAILVETARQLAASRPAGRGVLVASFDAEEPPHFLTDSMGAQHWVREPTVPLDAIDLMICMDLVGHAVGPPEAPDEVRASMFALGAERSEGTREHVDRLARAVPGVVVRRADAEVIPPLSDYCAFWEHQVPFLFLSNARWRYYHTPEDTPDKLDFDKMVASARWLERFVRATCGRPEPRVRFAAAERDDASTLRTVLGLTTALVDRSEEARMGQAMARALLDACDEQGRLPLPRRAEAQLLIGMLEQRLG
jgi:hypothetical protein